ncbi:MAG: polymer-forming cytoskeletal protein [Lachnospiraceae bacterium]|nr:polymer-forming cytoskeletal protein [Lachnospiraceae bacterium]
MLGKSDTQVKITTLIGHNAVLLGDFTAEGSARIDGRISGDVAVTGTLIIGATGSISGDVSAESVMIGGEVLGNVSVKEKAELTETAKVLGDISTKVIVIDEHAIFQGKCDMNQEIPEKKTPRKNSRTVRNVKKTAQAAIAEALREVQEEAAAEEAESDAQGEKEI